MMVEVVKEIENIMELAGVNPDADSTSISASYEETSKRNSPYPSYSYSWGTCFIVDYTFQDKALFQISFQSNDPQLPI